MSSGAYADIPATDDESPATLQEAVKKFFSTNMGMDDIKISSETFEDHIEEVNILNEEARGESRSYPGTN